MLKILSITAPLFILIGVGFGAVRFGLFPRENVRALGLFVINIALPALLFKALSERSFTEIMDGRYLGAYALGSLVMMGSGMAYAMLRQKKGLSASALFGLGMCCSNSGFIGYPVALQLVGEAAAVALALNMIVENVLMIPLAMMLAESGAGDGGKIGPLLVRSLVRLVKSPLILSILAGFACSVFQVHLPAAASRAVDMLALASGAVSLFVIGGTLVGIELQGMVGDVLRINLGKLAGHPLAVFLAFALVPIDPKLRMAAITFACVPMLSIYPIVGQRFQMERLCAAALLASTILSFGSISAVLWLSAATGVLPTAR